MTARRDDKAGRPPAADPPAPAQKTAERGKDVVVLGPPSADGEGFHVLRAREERLEAGELRALEQGKPIQGEVVTLEPRKNQPRVLDVTDSWVPPGPRAKGPAKVSTQAYRDGWDEIFGRRADRDGGALDDLN